MRHLKKAAATAAIALILLFCFALYTLAGFPIQSDWSNLEASLDEFINRGHPEWQTYDVTVHDSCTLGRTTYLLLRVEGELGSAITTRGPFGRHKLNRVSYGPQDTRNGIVTHEGTQYLLFAGRNLNLEVAQVSVCIDGVRHWLEVPRQRYFLTCTPLERHTDAVHTDPGSARAYNDLGEDITEEIGWRRGGGI